jgi:hypothetical protein
MSGVEQTAAQWRNVAIAAAIVLPWGVGMGTLLAWWYEAARKIVRALLDPAREGA